MANCYPKEYLERYEVINEKYYTKKDLDAKRNRDKRARELRKQGFKVTCEKWSFPDFGTGDMYTLEAERERECTLVL
jgi:hypothetical protein